ncbi:NADH-quinone oxidoreductase subunit C [Telmatobacter bradus]|uniref:NADH-quinone oxidoreductase subunit C n=1 Tax=Telmatobacter bradus TaxID=474953 RepID=UPI003B43862D
MATTTVDLAQNFQTLGLGEGWSWEKGSWWLTTPENFNLRSTTARLIELQARFVAITSTPQAEGKVRLDYQWDLNGQLLSFKVLRPENKLESIVDLVPGADWAERENYEYFAVEFTGRASLEPLMLRKGDQPGVLLPKEVTE